MRTISVGVALGFCVVVTGPVAAGCTSILGDFSPSGGGGDASTKDSGGPDAKPDHHDSGHPVDSSVDDSSGGNESGDAPADTGCANTLCGHPAVCTDTSSDPKNCGLCGRSCLGGACSGSRCSPVTLVDSTSGLASSIVDADTDGKVVVWGDSDGSINQVSKPGGPKLALLAATGTANVRGVAIGKGGTVAYTNSSPGSWSTATVGTAASGTLQGTFAASTITLGLMWDPLGKHVYFTSLTSYGSYYGYGTYDLVQCAPGSACNGYFLTGGYYPSLSNDVGVGAAGVVYSDVKLSTVYVYNPSDGTRLTIPSQAGAYHVAADADNVYWTTQVGSTHGIFSAAKGSTTVTVVLANAPGGPVQKLASDGTYVYFIDGGGALRYVPVGGASSATVLDASGVFASVKYANGALVYWTSNAIYLVATP